MSDVRQYHVRSRCLSVKYISYWEIPLNQDICLLNQAPVKFHHRNYMWNENEVYQI